jgi:FkbM family methyltransferase
MSTGISLDGSLAEILERLAPVVGGLPRRVPGRARIDGRELHYADLHSFYHQCVQIIGRGYYDFRPRSGSPYILDCGAHIGIASLFFATRFPGAEIHAYEADPRIFTMLARNVRSFGLGNVTPHHGALWTDDAGVPFAMSMDDSGHVGGAGPGAAPVPSVRLRDLLAARPPDLLKLDVEGAEYELLADCADVIGSVDRLIMEVHRFGREAGSLRELLGVLDAAGLRYVLADLENASWLAPDERPPFPRLASDKFCFTVFAWRPGT